MSNFNFSFMPAIPLEQIQQSDSAVVLYLERPYIPEVGEAAQQGLKARHKADDDQGQGCNGQNEGWADFMLAPL